MQSTTFIMVGLQSWDIEIGSNAKNIALELSNRYKVLFVNMPTDRASVLRSKPNSQVLSRMAINAMQKPQWERVNSNLHVFTPRVVLESINKVRPTALHDFFNCINNKRIAAEITKAMATLNMTDATLIIDNSMVKHFYLNELLPVSKTVYYLRDFLTEQPYFATHGKRLEPMLMAKVDAVFANSMQLASYASQFNPNSHFVGQGCDFDMLNPDCLPHPNIKSLKGPIIGYLGTLSSERLNLDWLVQLAKVKPEWNLVLVGPTDEAFEKSALKSMANVHFLGNQPATMVGPILQSFDVCINPQKVNTLTEGNYPRKIDEYLAMGKPVVATATQAMNLFKDYVFLSADFETFKEAIDYALEENAPATRAARIAFAHSHTWANSVNQMLQILSTSKAKF